MDIARDQYVRQWLRERDLKESSTKLYIRLLNKYCNFHSLTPAELIKEAREDQIKEPWLSDRHINDRLFDYYDHLKGNRLISSKSMVTVVRNFYNHFEIQLPKMRIKSQKKQQQLSSDIPGKKEIEFALQTCNLKYQAIILFMSSTGMSMSDVINLKIKTFFNALNIPPHVEGISQILDKNDYELVGTWNGERFKNSIPFITFNTPESTKAIVTYLQTRQEKLDPDQYLFTSDRGNGKIAIRTFCSHFTAINNRCNFGHSGKNHFFTSHQMRRFFTTTLTKHRVPYLFVEWMIGHKLPEVQGAYHKPSIEALKQEYLRVLSHLTIKGEVETEIITDEYVKHTDAEIAKLKETVKNLTKIVKSNSNKKEEKYKRLP